MNVLDTIDIIHQAKQASKQASTMSTTTASEQLAASKASKISSNLQSHRSLYVGGLEETVTDATLRAAMIPFGNLKSLDIPRDYQKGTNRGFGFVEYEDADDAAEAIFNMNGAELLGRVLTVNLAQAAQHKLGSNKAVWSSDDCKFVPNIYVF